MSGAPRLSSHVLEPVNQSLYTICTQIAVAHSTINLGEEASTTTTPMRPVPTYLLLLIKRRPPPAALYPTVRSLSARARLTDFFQTLFEYETHTNNDYITIILAFISPLYYEVVYRYYILNTSRSAFFRILYYYIPTKNDKWSHHGDAVL